MHTVPSTGHTVPPLSLSMVTASSGLSFISLTPEALPDPTVGEGALPGNPQIQHTCLSGHLAGSGGAMSSHGGAGGDFHSFSWVQGAQHSRAGHILAPGCCNARVTSVSGSLSCMFVRRDFTTLLHISYGGQVLTAWVRTSPDRVVCGQSRVGAFPRRAFWAGQRRQRRAALCPQLGESRSVVCLQHFQHWDFALSSDLAWVPARLLEVGT